MKLALVMVAGGLGSGARYLVALALGGVTDRLPLGTLAVNVAGCFLMSLVQEVALRSARLPEEARLALTTGLLGGFTTYSAFHHETFTLVRGGSGALALGYVSLTLVAGFVAGFAGLAVARALVGH
jgi:CrcB protein